MLTAASCSASAAGCCGTASGGGAAGSSPSVSGTGDSVSGSGDLAALPPPLLSRALRRGEGVTRVAEPPGVGAGLAVPAALLRLRPRAEAGDAGGACAWGAGLWVAALEALRVA